MADTSNRRRKARQALMQRMKAKKMMAEKAMMMAKPDMMKGMK